MMLMQLSSFEHLYLRFQSSDASFEIIAINVITSLTYVTHESADLLSVLNTIPRQANKIEKVHATQNDSFS